MADIVQLIENGVKKFMKTHAKAVEGLYPVGAVYVSVNSVNPSTLFGGTWERFAKGQTLVGVNESDTDFSAVNKTGGAKTHKLTVNELAKHTHYGKISTIQHVQTPGAGSNYGFIGNGAWSNVDSTGGDQPHNNMQPYITVYMWVRTA